MSDSRWIGPLMQQITEAHPRLLPLQMAEFQKFEAQLHDLIAGRLGGGADDVRALALAGAIIGVGRATFDRWRNDEKADIPARLRESLEALLKTIRG